MCLNEAFYWNAKKCIRRTSARMVWKLYRDYSCIYVETCVTWPSVPGRIRLLIVSMITINDSSMVDVPWGTWCSNLWLMFLIHPNNINIIHRGKTKVSVSVRCLVLPDHSWRINDYATFARSKYLGPSTYNVSGQAILQNLTRKDVFFKQADMKFCLIPKKKLIYIFF